MAILSLQFTVLKLSSADTAEGLALLGSAASFAGVGLILLPTLARNPNPYDASGISRRKVLLFVAELGFGALAFSTYLVVTKSRTGRLGSKTFILADAALFSFISVIFLTALYYGLRLSPGRGPTEGESDRE